MKGDDADMAVYAPDTEGGGQMQSQLQKPRGPRAFLKRAWASWATRSLAVGAVATAIDVCVLLVCVTWFALSNPIAAMVGVLFGSTFTFFANKYFAFRDHNPAVAPQAAKFVVATGIGMLVHAQFVYVFADRLGVNVVLAKFGADILVFTFGQMLVMRYVIFPKKKAVAVPGEDRSLPVIPAAADTAAEVGIAAR